MSLFEMREVRFRYNPRGPWLLDGIDLVVSPGDRVGIIGDNGVGKSTLARLLLGLIRPAEGTIRLFGQPVAWRTHFPRLGYIGTPSERDGESALPGTLRVGRLLDASTALFKTAGQHLPEAAGLLHALGLDSDVLRRTRVDQLSHGQHRRVQAFLALAKGPALLVGDEATEGLDAESRQCIQQVVEQHIRQHGMGLVWITHRLDEIARLACRVLRIQNGALTPCTAVGLSCTLSGCGEPISYAGLRPGDVLGLLGQALLEERFENLMLTVRRQEVEHA